MKIQNPSFEQMHNESKEAITSIKEISQEAIDYVHKERFTRDIEDSMNFETTVFKKRKKANDTFSNEDKERMIEIINKRDNNIVDTTTLAELQTSFAFAYQGDTSLTNKIYEMANRLASNPPIDQKENKPYDVIGYRIRFYYIPSDEIYAIATRASRAQNNVDFTCEVIFGKEGSAFVRGSAVFGFEDLDDNEQPNQPPAEK